MKTNMTLAAIALCSACLTSCNGKDDSKFTTTTPIQSYNLFVSKADGNVYTSLGKYDFTLESPANTIAVGTEGIAAPGLGILSFTTNPGAYEARYYDYDGKRGETIGFKALSSTASGLVSNLGGALTQCVFAPGSIDVPGYKRVVPDASTFHWAMISYTCMNIWDVNTFWCDMTYSGTTRNSVPGAAETQTDQPRYRVWMQRDLNNSLNGKVDIIVYNASFAQGMPSITFVLKDLDLRFTQTGFEITGKDIIPSMVEGGALQPNPKYLVNDFAFRGFAGADGCGLSQGEAVYTVQGRFGARFEGACVVGI